MRALTDREMQVWIDNWLRRNRPGDVRPFYLTRMMCDFQTELKGDGHADEEGQQQKDDQQKH